MQDRHAPSQMLSKMWFWCCSLQCTYYHTLEDILNIWQLFFVSQCVNFSCGSAERPFHLTCVLWLVWVCTNLLFQDEMGLPNHWHADVLASSVALVLIMQMGLSSQRKSSDTLRLWDHVTFSYLQCVQDVSGVVWLLGASHLPLPLPPWKRCQEHGSYPYRVYAKANVYLLFQSHSVRRQGLLQSFMQALISLNI